MGLSDSRVQAWQLNAVAISTVEVNMEPGIGPRRLSMASP
jgi:hypothetical protein